MELPISPILETFWSLWLYVYLKKSVDKKGQICQYVTPTELLQYCDTLGVLLDKEQPYITQFPLVIIQNNSVNSHWFKTH